MIAVLMGQMGMLIIGQLGLIVGLLIGLIMGLMIGLIMGLIVGLMIGLIIWLIYWPGRRRPGQLVRQAAPSQKELALSTYLGEVLDVSAHDGWVLLHSERPEPVLGDGE